MALLKILTFPAPVLAEKAIEVTEFNDELRNLVSDMKETLKTVEGLGLAAPQIGISKRLFVFHVPSGEEKIPLTEVINPVLEDGSGVVYEDEGCLSIPEYSVKVRRFELVMIKGYNMYGNEIRFAGHGLLARIFQHEIDHLNGMLILDRISSLKRDLFLRKFKKINRDETVNT